MIIALSIIAGTARAAWFAQDHGGEDALRGVTAFSEDYLYVVGENGATFSSTDGGENWTAHDSGTTERLNGVDAAGELRMFAAGNNGMILRSTDKGETWEVQSSSKSVDFNAIDMVTANIGTIAGDGGVILTTGNSGLNWKSRSTSVQSDLNGVWYEDNSSIWAVGDEGVILMSSNAGATWEKRTTPTSEDLQDVVFPTNKVGFAVGESGTVLRTTNGGTTWVEMDITDEDLYAIDMLDADNLTIVGDNISLSTTDRGETWSEDAYDNDSPMFRDVLFYSDALRVAVGSDGGVGFVDTFDESAQEQEEEPAVSDQYSAGDLVKIICEDAADVNDPCKAVYYYSEAGTRHAFPNDKTYFTWYDNFDDVKEITAEAMAEIPLGANVTYRPGVKMVKFVTANTVYAVSAGVLRPIASESIAEALYGTDWNRQIDDISDAFYSNYSYGEEVADAAGYDPDAQLQLYESIDDVL